MPRPISRNVRSNFYSLENTNSVNWWQGPLAIVSNHGAIA